MTLDVKQQILTYVSDYNILSTTLFPHLTKADFSKYDHGKLGPFNVFLQRF